MLTENTFPLPTFDALGVDPQSLASDIDVHSIIATWFTSFSNAISTRNASDLTSLMVKDSYWRDILALTWDFRTFCGISKIGAFARDKVVHPDVSITGLELVDRHYHSLMRPYDDIASSYLTPIINFLYLQY
jgi:hypothetical protein